MKKLKLLLLIILYCLWTLNGGAQVLQRIGSNGIETPYSYSTKGAFLPQDTLAPPAWLPGLSSIAVKGDMLWIWSTTENKYILPVTGSPAIAYGDVIGLADSMNLRQLKLPYNGFSTYYMAGNHQLYNLDSLLQAYDFVKSTDTIFTNIEGSVDPNDIPGLTTYIRNTLFGGTAIIYNPNTGVIAIDSALVVSWLSGALTDVPTLQEVLTEGNTTNLGFVATADIALDGNGNNLTIGDYDNGSGGTKLTVGQSLATLSGQWLSTGAFYYDDGTSAYTARMYVEGLTANRILQFPNASGYAAISVNGTLADANGNITISTGGATPGIDDVLAVGQAFTTSRTMLVGTGGLVINGTNTASSGSLYVINGGGGIGTSLNSTGTFWPTVRMQNTSAGPVLQAWSAGGVPIEAMTTGDNSSIYPTLVLRRYSSTNAGIDGVGQKMVFQTVAETGSSTFQSNEIVSTWSDATEATRTSQLKFTGINNASIVDLLTLNGNGSITAGYYGDGTFTGTATYGAAFDADGNLIEVALGGGGGTSTFNDVLVAGPDITASRTIAGTGTLTINPTTGGEIYAGNLAGVSSGLFATNGNSSYMQASDVTNDNYAYVSIQANTTAGAGGYVIIEADASSTSQRHNIKVNHDYIEFRNNTGTPNVFVRLKNLPVYADEAAAAAASLAQNTIYKTSTGELRIKL